MIVVEDIATIAPAKTLSSTVHPNARPAMKPSHTMMLDWTRAVIPAVGATCTSLRRLNSSPSATEYPDASARYENAKQTPRLATSSSSGSPRRRT